MTAILVDTGILVAMLDRDDPHHAAAQGLFSKNKGPFVVPSAVLPEVCYLAEKYLGSAAEQTFVASLAQEELPVDWAGPEDLSRAAEILRSRPDLGYVDAMVVATAERLKIRRIATLDRRHFGSFKPRHCSAFELLP